jgi:hypothetical protein
MTGEKLRRIQKARPFRPFVLHLADGREVRVRHPELLMLDPTGRIAVVFYPDGDLHIVDIPLVTEILFKRGARGGSRA